MLRTSWKKTRSKTARRFSALLSCMATTTSSASAVVTGEATTSSSNAPPSISRYVRMRPSPPAGASDSSAAPTTWAPPQSWQAGPDPQPSGPSCALTHCTRSPMRWPRTSSGELAPTLASILALTAMIRHWWFSTIAGSGIVSSIVLARSLERNASRSLWIRVSTDGDICMVVSAPCAAAPSGVTVSHAWFSGERNATVLRESRDASHSD